MAAPVLWVWNHEDELIYEGQFIGSPMKNGIAYRYKHLCHDGIKEGLFLTQKMIDNAIVVDDVYLEVNGLLTVEFADVET